ncbi:porin family protein [Echinicola jeungdonensis]|uniref:Porin family protein n=1 Tax=Echinicola jeungdonensis TaxID=709343 RepID=A0ABV5J789_9BACT|nr:porin family protein [Echinicola jeungdonensis]MDN3668699.1 porin family protein [Echinicola jeungdonensis]
MKKVLFVILAFLAIGAVQAQDFSIGPKVGISQGNISVDGDGYESGSDKLGYHVGAFVRMGGNSLYVQPEVLYTNTGGEIKQTQGPEQRTFEASFDRLDVPVMVGFKLADFFRIQGGPIASFLLNSEFSAEDESPDFNNSTIGYQAGIGLDISNMIIDLKYEGALSKQAESIGGIPTDQRQNQLILSLGLRLF